MTTSSKQTLQRFTQCFHSLTEVSADSEFLCKGCRTTGSGTRHRCEVCDLDLHEFCADCPMKLSSFMHKHSLKLVVKPSHVCDLCEDPVKGLCYRCELCDFDMHPMCIVLAEYVRSELDKDQPQSSDGEVQGQGGKVRKRVRAIAENLALNVVGGLILAAMGIGNS